MIRALLLLCLAGMSAIPVGARAADPVVFGLDWRAEAEYGGYYQALATGLYAEQGLDVSLRQGGPQINQAQLLLAGRLTMMIGSNAFLALNYVQEKLPLIAVGAGFQKDPAVLIAHPGQGNDSFAALKGKPIMIGADTRTSWWGFLKAKYGYGDGQIRPYTFNLAPFLADKSAVQQGYIGSEPYMVEQATKETPVVLMLADAGFRGYGSLVVAGTKLVQGKPDVVRRFLAASAEGWRGFLQGDPTPADTLIKKDNPEMTDGLLAYGRDALNRYGIVISGDATTQGIYAQGIYAMTEARWKQFFDQVAGEGLYPKTLPWQKAYTLQFVGVGASGAGATGKP
jgi:NitT/TauT family transport system substrate-binding protein